MSDSGQYYGLEPIRLLCPWDSPGKITGAGCHALLQGHFLTQRLNPRLMSPSLQVGSLPLVPPTKPVIVLTSPKHPVSCIEPGLATRFIYDIIHVSMPFSQIFPPSPSPTESKRLFNISVSLLLSHLHSLINPSIFTFS